MLCTDGNKISSTILLIPEFSFSGLVVKPTNMKAIGAIDVAAISHEISSNQKNRKLYFRWTDIPLVNMLWNIGTPLPLENLKANSHISMRVLFVHSKRKSRMKSKKLQKKGGSQSNK